MTSEATSAASSAYPTRGGRSRSADGWRVGASMASTSRSSTCATTPGLVQCVVDGAADLRSEYVVRVSGTVRPRPDGTANPNLPTGEIEIGDCTVEVLSVAEPPPFPIDERADQVDESVRLRYRYLDVRRERMQRNLRIRAKVNSAIRAAMERQGFVEVETPMLMASTPEGAREFLVPSRQSRGFLLRAPAEPAALQAAADGRRHRSLLPDRSLPARRGPPRRSPIRVHAVRRRGELRRPGRCDGVHQRGGARRGGGDRRRAARRSSTR